MERRLIGVTLRETKRASWIGLQRAFLWHPVTKATNGKPLPSLQAPQSIYKEFLMNNPFSEVYFYVDKRTSNSLLNSYGIRSYRQHFELVGEPRQVKNGTLLSSAQCHT